MRLWLSIPRRWWLALCAGVLCLLGLLAYVHLKEYPAEAFPDDPVRQFKYGSTGGDILAGIPEGIFNALPKLCRKYLPGEGWQSLGFIVDPDDQMSRPVGTSKRRKYGFDRISLNCAACHTGTYRPSPGEAPVVVPGMPANRIDLGAFAKGLTNCALDERFSPWEVMQAAQEAGAHYSFLDRMLLQYFAAPAIREALIVLRWRFRFLDHEPTPGPGRFDTFGPEKALLNWPLDDLAPRERIGLVDFPSLWRQKPREGMHLHWDGNNDFLPERNLSAAFGTGAVPIYLDEKSMALTERWLLSEANHPPDYPFAIDLAKRDRGKPLYDKYCANCHGANGRDFSGYRVGQVEPIENVGTDPCRLDNYTEALSVEQGNLYAAYPDKRFSHFQKTRGYANAPLDGIWLRAPYLHNGSVPTVRDLLEPAARRPAFFYRGNDVIDREKLGFEAGSPELGGVAFFRFETRCVDSDEICRVQANPENRSDNNVCTPGPWAGNSNKGHEGEGYGTTLKPDEKDAIVEYLKTF